MALPFLHLVAAVLNFYTLWYDQKYINLKFSEGLENYPFRSRILFLTMWNLTLQAVYMAIAFLNDIIGTNAASPKKPPVIRKIKDALFSLAYPFAIYVSIAFWGIYYVDKDLIFPEHLEKAFPPWTNHVMHTLVAVFINVEMFTAHINYPSKFINLALVQLFVSSYIVCLFVVYGQSGLWVYPILGFLNWPARLLFISGSIVVANIFNVVGRTLNRQLSSVKVKSK
ncbi:androgen-dependent TFPI-regulating protein-like [Colias croceus]|uniref:androgen-dependent TFPI-regulating protein-like n=1 Tax=Colias crocea TaxID=72248 RepID=UPI001E27AB44|nr:androgen-dependent TFPI-regulating protein-like [Colias croceus]